MRRRKGGRIDRDHRADIALRFKAMYRNLGLDLSGCAQLLQVSGRTLHNWESGRHVIPFAAYKLLRLLNGMELPGPSWSGWSFSGGKLHSPEGRGFSGNDASWWSLLVRRAAMFDALYRENQALRARCGAAGKVSREMGKQAQTVLACDGPDEPVFALAGAQLPQATGGNFSVGCVRSHEMPPMVITGITYGVSLYGIRGPV